VIRGISIALFVVLLAGTADSQNSSGKEIDLEMLADKIFGFQDLDLNYQELYENMAQLLSHPINLNTATAEELRFLNLLSEEQVQNLMAYRTENGDLISVFEIQAIPGFDPDIAQKIMPFVTVEETRAAKKLLGRIQTEKNNYLLIRYGKSLEQKSGFKESTNGQSRFRGSDGDMYLRYRTSRPGDFSFGVTMERDAGEQLTWDIRQRQYGFDFNSVHAQLQNKGKLKNIIVGDFQTQFAQALTLGGGIGFGKGAETVTTIRRSNLGFLPYTSANEFGFKRGIAVTYKLLSQIEVSAFYSNTSNDGTIGNDSGDHSIVSSFQTTGLHRNKKELQTRHQIREQNTGLVIAYRKNNFEAGTIFNAINFSKTILPKPQPYNQFEFAGHQVQNLGSYLNYSRYNFTFFTEAAHTVNNGNGFIAGLLGSLTPKLDIAIHARHYQRNFQSLRSSAFAEGSEPQNETGIYWGWKYQFRRKVTASGYADLFKFPWLRFRNYAPSDGHEVLFRLNYQPTKTTQMYVQVREEVKTRNFSQDNSVNNFAIAEGVKRSYCINFDYPATLNLKLKTRAQFSSYSINNTYTKGMVIAQDISVDIWRISIVGRYALFDTDDFDNRQYLYERDVWLAYSLPAYAGSGIRKYIMAEYKLAKRLSFWVRFATTRYTDRDAIGSDADTIRGGTKRDLRLQARIKF
jgi:hypothetical protein